MGNAGMLRTHFEPFQAYTTSISCTENRSTSNAMLMHLSSENDAKTIVDEMVRVAKRLVVISDVIDSETVEQMHRLRGSTFKNQKYGSLQFDFLGLRKDWWKKKFAG